MASDTNINLRNQVMYSVYVRNHTPEGTFKAFEKDLPRIKQMGVDVIWLMPIHPIGVVGKRENLDALIQLRITGLSIPHTEPEKILYSLLMQSMVSE